ncbi:MAG: T9SS type A sorting domain-containing protein [Bacteroidota bacterium]
MKFFSLLFTTVLTFALDLSIAQTPQVHDSSLQVTELMQVKKNAVRIARNPADHFLYYITFNGNIYKINTSGGVYSDTLVSDSSKHHINYLQGMLFKDSTLYLVGNHKIPNSAGHGLVMAGRFQVDGAWLWDTLMYTAPYQSTATLFDHAFSSICLNVAGDSIYIGSGSRTDHGEVESTGGLFPGVREVPLTSTVFRLPLNIISPVYIPNDSAFAVFSPYIYCRGVRNSFDLLLLPNNDLIGSENSGDRDDPEELNWLRQDQHYGFPWRMGGNATGMQFPGYDPLTDFLINDSCSSAKSVNFYNDSAYPPAPAFSLSEPIKNYGPDADKYRDPLNGSVHDASDEGIYISSFTSHRSPLGLALDKESKLAMPYTQGCFMLSYTEGTEDTTGSFANGSIGPFSDVSQDLLQLALYKDTATNEYSMNCYRLASGFHNPVDSWIEDSIIYILESHYPNNPLPAKLYALTFKGINSGPELLPADTLICSSTTLVLKANVKGRFNYLWSTGETTSQISVTPASATSVSVIADNGIITIHDTINIRITHAPDACTAIVVSGGLSKVCPGDSRTFITSPGRGVTYEWDVPAGLVINSGQGTRSINVTVNNNFTAAGDVTVMKVNSCGNSLLKALTINRNDSVVPGPVSGNPFGLCNSFNNIYSIAELPGSTYNWTVPAGAVIQSGQGTKEIAVDFPSLNISGTINVNTSNTCGSVSDVSLSVSTTPVIPDPVNGPRTVVSNSSGNIYTVSPLPGAIDYTWTSPPGSVLTANGITSPANIITTSATTVEVTFGIVFPFSEIKVKGNNDCGSGGERSLILKQGVYRQGKNDATDFVILSSNEGYILLRSTGDEIVIFNLFGEPVVIHNRKENAPSVVKIDISSLASGMYIVRSGNKSERIIVAR